MIRIFTLILSVTFFILTSSCQKYYDKTYEDYDLVQLKYDTGTDFASFETFTISDSLVFVRDTIYDGENGYPDFNIDMDANTDGKYSAQILEKVKSHFVSLGLRQIDETEGEVPDLSVSVSSMTLKQITQYTWFPVGMYDPWWGGGMYNNYYTWAVTSYYSSNNGMLSIDVFDIANAELKKDALEAKSIWHGTYEGLVGPTYESYTARVLAGIDELFYSEEAFTKASMR